MELAEALDRIDELEPDAPEWSIRLDAVKVVPEYREDADGAIWYRRELERIKLRVIARRYPDLPMAEGRILPKRSTIPRGLRTVSYYIANHFGVARWLTTGAWSDIPRSDVSMTPKSYTAHSFSLGYGWTLEEREASKGTGVELNTQKAFANRRGMMVFANNVGLYGDAAHGHQGFFNLQNMTVVDAPAGDAGAFRWSTTGSTAKTQLEMKDDVILLRRTIRTLTNNQHNLAIVWIPPTFYEALTNPINTGSSKSGWNYLKETFPDIDFRVLFECENAGSNGGPCIMGMATLGPEDCWFEENIPYEEYGPVQEGLEWVQMARMSTGGVICHFPQAFIKMEFPAES